MINAVVLIATGVSADGHREVLGCKVATNERTRAWNTFFTDLVARGLTDGAGWVLLVTSDAHTVPVDVPPGNARTYNAQSRLAGG